MLIVISPAKKLRESKPDCALPCTQPELLEQAATLIDILREKDSFEIADLMKLSMKLADLNVQRFHDWHTPFTHQNAAAALLMFQGDVYQGMDAESFSEDDMRFANQHLRILSGLYGVLRPLDFMQAYRLEMGTRLANAKGANLYAYWGEHITNTLNQSLSDQGDDTLINLASTEYFKAVQPKNLQANIITPTFKEYHQGAYKVIGIHAKKARGMMSRFIIQNRLEHTEDIKAFDVADYSFHAEHSSANEWVFTRG